MRMNFDYIILRASSVWKCAIWNRFQCPIAANWIFCKTDDEKKHWNISAEKVRIKNLNKDESKKQSGSKCSASNLAME